MEKWNGDKRKNYGGMALTEHKILLAFFFFFLFGEFAFDFVKCVCV